MSAGKTRRNSLEIGPRIATTKPIDKDRLRKDSSDPRRGAVPIYNKSVAWAAKRGLGS